MHRKKILSTLLKLLVGFGSLLVIYIRLKSDLTPERLSLLGASAFSPMGILFFMFCILCIGLNWGIESYKWKIITAPVERISFKTALKSVYSGVCLGNLAPGRATEFIAKIFFFSPENRSKITVLHFINGLFQFSVTIVAGFIALTFKLNDFGKNYSWIVYATSITGSVILILFGLCIYKIDRLLNFISKKISRKKQIDAFHYNFSGRMLLQLFGFSIIRYAVFFSQLSLLIYLFHPFNFTASVFTGVALYFIITSIIPMISVLEAAIRAAVALVVFKDSGIGHTVLALSTVLLWFLNIVIPSAIGYYFLVKQKFNFKLSEVEK